MSQARTRKTSEIRGSFGAEVHANSVLTISPLAMASYIAHVTYY